MVRYRYHTIIPTKYYYVEHPGLHLSLLTIFNCRVRRTGGPVASDRPSLQHECGIPSLHDTCPVVIQRHLVQGWAVTSHLCDWFSVYSGLDGILRHRQKPGGSVFPSLHFSQERVRETIPIPVSNHTTLTGRLVWCLGRCRLGLVTLSAFGDQLLRISRVLKQEKKLSPNGLVLRLLFLRLTQNLGLLAHLGCVVGTSSYPRHPERLFRSRLFFSYLRPNSSTAGNRSFYQSSLAESLHPLTAPPFSPPPLTVYFRI